MLGGSDILLLVRWTCGTGARCLVGQIAGLCTHSNVGYFYHSLFQWLASGDGRTEANLFLALAFLCHSGRCILCHRNHGRIGMVLLDGASASWPQTVKTGNSDERPEFLLSAFQISTFPPHHPVSFLTANVLGFVATR